MKAEVITLSVRTGFRLVGSEIVCVTFSSAE